MSAPVWSSNQSDIANVTYPILIRPNFYRGLTITILSPKSTLPAFGLLCLSPYWIDVLLFQAPNCKPKLSEICLTFPFKSSIKEIICCASNYHMLDQPYAQLPYSLIHFAYCPRFSSPFPTGIQSPLIFTSEPMFFCSNHSGASHPLTSITENCFTHW